VGIFGFLEDQASILTRMEAAAQDGTMQEN